MATVAQTPGTWLKGGAGGLWSAACRAALIACGINPDNFGDYDARAKAQEVERKKYRDQRVADAKKKGKNRRPHEPNCKTGSNPKKMCQCIESDAALKDLGPERWMLANSQSGHISQNAFYQGEGARGNPCTNIPPTDGNAGTYGYQDNKAFCMDHLGRSNKKGTGHYEITRREERFAAHMADQGHTVMTQKQLEQGVEGSASIAAAGAQAGQSSNDPHASWDKPDGIESEREVEAQRLDKAKDQHAAALQEKENAKKNAGKSGRGKGRKPNKPSVKSPTKKQVKKAVDCIKDAWRQALNEMRDNVVNEHSMAAKSAECKDEIADYNKKRKKGQPEAKSYTDLPAKRRRNVDDKVRERVEKRQKALEKKGAHNNGEGKSTPPTEEECLEYQANWLYQNRRVNGTYPPMQGRVPDSSSSSTMTTPTTKPGRKKRR